MSVRILRNQELSQGVPDRLKDLFCARRPIQDGNHDGGTAAFRGRPTGHLATRRPG